MEGKEAHNGRGLYEVTAGKVLIHPVYQPAQEWGCGIGLVVDNDNSNN